MINHYPYFMIPRTFPIINPRGFGEVMIFLAYPYEVFDTSLNYLVPEKSTHNLQAKKAKIQSQMPEGRKRGIC